MIKIQWKQKESLINQNIINFFKKKYYTYSCLQRIYLTFLTALLALGKWLLPHWLQVDGIVKCSSTPEFEVGDKGTENGWIWFISTSLILSRQSWILDWVFSLHLTPYPCPYTYTSVLTIALMNRSRHWTAIAANGTKKVT